MNPYYTLDGYDKFDRNTLTHFNLLGHLFNICLIYTRLICNKKVDLTLFVSIYHSSVLLISGAWTNKNISEQGISIDNRFLYLNDGLKERQECPIHAKSILNSLLCDMPGLKKTAGLGMDYLNLSNSIFIALRLCLPST